MPLLATIVHGPSWALRRAAAHALLEIETAVPPTMKQAHAAEMGKLAARLVERRWRDKEWGDAASRIEAIARAHGHAPTRADEEPGDEPPPPPPRTDAEAAKAAAAAEEEDD